MKILDSYYNSVYGYFNSSIMECQKYSILQIIFILHTPRIGMLRKNKTFIPVFFLAFGFPSQSNLPVM